MTSSKSRASTSSWWALAVAVVGVLLLVPANGHAGGRKRVVVLELEGPKAEKFHEDLVKLIKKSHTVIPIDKWNGTAEDLDASKANERDYKKVAKKLKVDAIITGKIDKRRDEYIIKLKLREGKTGALVGGGIDTKAEGPRIDGKAQKDLKDELIEAIGNVDANRGGADEEEEEEEEEEEDKPKKKVAKKDDEEDQDEEAKPAKKGFSRKDDDEQQDEEAKPAKKGSSRKDDEEDQDEEAKPAKKGFSRKDDEDEEPKPRNKGFSRKDDKNDEGEEDEEAKPAKMGFSRNDDEVTGKSKNNDEEEDPLPRSNKKPVVKDDEDEDEDKPKKKVAAKDDEDEDEDTNKVEQDSGDDEAGAPMSALSAGERAVDAVVGLSFNARRMSFASEPGLANGPPPYKGVPVAGLLIDATVFPLAIGHNNKGMGKNFGATLMFDKVLWISSKTGTPEVSLPTTQSRYAFGAAFRYPLGKLTVGATLRYGRQSFNIKAIGGVMPDIPNVNYTIIDPSLVARYQVMPKVLLNVNLGFMLLTNTGQIQNPDQYGPATVTGFEGEIGGDYLLTKNIFVRAALKFETIGFKFRGGAMKTNIKYDPSDNTQDVFGARDSYLGGAATVGYLY